MVDGYRHVIEQNEATEQLAALQSQYQWLGHARCRFFGIPEDSLEMLAGLTGLFSFFLGVERGSVSLVELHTHGPCR